MKSGTNLRKSNSARQGSDTRLLQGGFLLVLLYFTFEYLRIQDNILPFLGALKAPMFISFALLIYLFRQKLNFLNDPVVLVFFLFVVEIVLWVPFARNNFYAFQTAKTMAITAVSVFALIAAITNEKRLLFFLKFLSFLVIIVSVWVLTHGGRGPGGFIQDENDVALFLVSGLPIVFYILVPGAHRFDKVAGVIGCLLILAAVVATSSRGGFVGLVAVVGVMIWSSRKRWRNIGLVFMFSFFAGGLFLSFVPSSYLEEVKSISNTNEGTASLRFLHWTTAFEIFKDNPILGVGPNNYPWRSGDYLHLSPYFVEGARFRSGRQAHSLYFTLIPELGFLGIFLFSFMTFQYFKRARILRQSSIHIYKNILDPESIGKALKCSMVGFLVSGIFISVLYYPIYWHLLGLSVSVFLINKANESEYDKGKAV